MEKNTSFLCCCFISLALGICASRALAEESQAALTAPTSEPLSKNFTISANKKNVPVYVAKVCSLSAEERRTFNTNKPENFTNAINSDETSFASFDLNGSTTVTVTSFTPIQKVQLLPSSSGITPQVSGNTITFTVSKPGQFVLEINGDWLHSLQLFANPPETDIPNPKDPNVIYFAPGIHVVDCMIIGSNKTVYLAEGAIVYGKIPEGQKLPRSIFTLEGDNITLRGRGIIDGSLCPRHSRNIVRANNSTNIHIEGVILRDPSGWALPIRTSNRVTIKNVKIFGYRANSDGIDICNSTDVTASDSYLRTFDDLIVIKTIDKNGKESKNITITKCVLWNEFAHALSLGAELQKNIENVVFSDCDIIRDKGRESLLRVFQCDSSFVKNVLFENIRIEESRRMMSLWIGKAKWSKDEERGHIDNVTFRNIQSVASTLSEPLVQLKGYDAEHAIRDVKLENIVVQNKPLQISDVQQNEFVHDVKLAP